MPRASARQMSPEMNMTKVLGPGRPRTLAIGRPALMIFGGAAEMTQSPLLFPTRPSRKPPGKSADLPIPGRSWLFRPQAETLNTLEDT